VQESLQGDVVIDDSACTHVLGVSKCNAWLWCEVLIKSMGEFDCVATIEEHSPLLVLLASWIM
jgi:hypothetical protein